MKKLMVFALLLFQLPAISQITQEDVQKFFLDDLSVKSLRLNNEILVENFYDINFHQLIWMRAEDTLLRRELLLFLSSAPEFGLNEQDYQFPFIQSIKAGWMPSSSMDTIMSDLRLTDAAIHFLCDLKNGNRPPVLGYNGIQYEPATTPVIFLLASYCNRHCLQGIAEQVEPRYREYANAKNLLAQLNKVTMQKDFSEVIIRSATVNNRNSSLLVKLYQLGFLDSVYAIEGKLLTKKLQEVQKLLDVLNDGVLRSTTLAALNVPVRQRKEEIKTTLNYLRWVSGLRQSGPIAVLNIPSAMLYVYFGDTLRLSSRIVAGKALTPTPTLSSRINEVIIYPYWHVPYKIATRELLPQIKRNIGYLELNNFQVLSKSGNVLDPYKIDWHKLSISYFPYSIRQGTGCDNSLGLLKFNFYNPFTVYLHDTPFKNMFYLNKRYFSHGCMRVEKPVELAEILLEENASVLDTLIQSCLLHQKPRTLPVAKPLSLVVLYSIGWYTENGEIKFFEDVYHKR